MIGFSRWVCFSRSFQNLCSSKSVLYYRNWWLHVFVIIRKPSSMQRLQFSQGNIKFYIVWFNTSFQLFENLTCIPTLVFVWLKAFDAFNHWYILWLEEIDVVFWYVLHQKAIILQQLIHSKCNLAVENVKYKQYFRIFC